MRETTRHCKVCDPADFRDPELRRLIREVFATEIPRFRRFRGRHWYQSFPAGSEDRRYWEAAMAIRAMESLGVLRADAELLGIGPGTEPMAYWLTRRVRRVFASSIRRVEGAWTNSGDGDGAALVDPARQWPEIWNPERLVVQPMSPLDLRYDDESFDTVFSMRALERLDDVAEVSRAAEEIYRVLRRGGVATISTVLRVEGGRPASARPIPLDEPELREALLDGLLWTLASPIDSTLSPDARRTAIAVDEGSERWDSQGASETYPRIAWRQGGSLWAAVHLTLVRLVR